MAKAGLRPIDSTAIRVAGLRQAAQKAELAKRIKALQKQVESAEDPLAIAKLRAEIVRLGAEQRDGSIPAVGPSAIRKAQRALERAKWERGNR